MRFPIALALASSLTAAQASVHVVDANAGPGHDFVQIHEAIAASVDGDTILVRGGGYEPFTVDGKSLAITREEGVDARVVGGSVTVRNLAPAQSVVIRGLRNVPAAEEGLVVEDCEGTVWFEECRWVGGSGKPAFSGARLLRAERAIFVHGVGLGGRGSGSLSDYSGATGGSGIHAESTNVYAWEMGLEGRRGGAGYGFAGSGGSGLYADTEPGITIFVAASRLVGQDGGMSDGDYDFWCRCTICGYPGDGGDGITIEGPKTTNVIVRDNAYLPGAGGLTQAIFDCNPGEDGEDVGTKNPNTPVIEYAAGVPRFSSSNPTREGQPLDLQSIGAPGDLVALLLATAPSAAWIDPWLGALGLLPPVSLLALGEVPASGTLATSFPAPALPPHLQAAVLFAQPVHLGADGTVELSTPSALFLLDAAL